MMRRWFGCILAALIGTLALPTTVAADSAGPTDYRTSIVSVEPDPAGAVEFTIEGGDAFVRATVSRGHTLVVYGYDDEEYLKIDADGKVFENRASESYYYNQERYGGAVPSSADSSAPPDWVEVDDDGEYAWHDHRAHWMSPTVLTGMHPGDALPEQTIDVTIDATPTTITVRTTLQRRASPLWLVLGLVIGLAGAASALLGRRPTQMLAVLTPSAAVFTGLAQTLALPSSTGTPMYWWALPLAALITALIGFWFTDDARVQAIVWLAVGVELVVWGEPRIRGVLDAYRPTIGPVAIDRILTVAIPVAALGLFIGAARFWFGIGTATRAPQPESTG